MTEKNYDLFGNEVEEPEYTTPKHLMSKYQLFKKQNNFRDGFGRFKCQYCKYRVAGSYHGKLYNKCELMGISHSEATDIRLKNLCNLFKEEQ